MFVNTHVDADGDENTDSVANTNADSVTDAHVYSD